jgi:hypothetical protein
MQFYSNIFKNIDFVRYNRENHLKKCLEPTIQIFLFVITEFVITEFDCILSNLLHNN